MTHKSGRKGTMTKSRSTPTIGRRPNVASGGTTPPRTVADKSTGTASTKEKPAQAVSISKRPVVASAERTSAEKKSAEKKSTSSRKPAPTKITMAKTKRLAGDRAAPKAVKAARPTTAQAAVHQQVAAAAAAAADVGFAERFAAAVQRIGRGVTIGVDEDLNFGVVQHATEEEAAASRKGYATGKTGIADGQDDARLRDLAATVRPFIRNASETTRVNARARFAAAVLGVRAADATEVGAVADAAVEGLRARLDGKPPKNAALPPDEVTLLDEAATAWRQTPDADFWTDLAAAAQPAEGATVLSHLQEQAMWMGLVATLSLADLTSPPPDAQGHTTPPWAWATAAEKADLVDTLIAAGAQDPNPAAAVLRRLSTLQRGTDPIPRAVAAELAQLALAALAGEKKAATPDRADALKIKMRPPAQADAADQTRYQDSENLRAVAQDLVGPIPMFPKFELELFRDKLSSLYVDVREQFRQQPATGPGALTGEQRYQRLAGVLGSLDRTLVHALDDWSEALASGSTDPAHYLTRAQTVQTVVNAWLDRLDATVEAPDDTSESAEEGSTESDDEAPEPARVAVIPLTGPERDVLGAAVRELAAEIGYEAGEVLRGQLQPVNEPAAGVRKGLQKIRAVESALEVERVARAGAKLKAGRMATKLNAAFPTAAQVPAWGKALQTAAKNFDTAADASKKTVDPAEVSRMVTELLDKGDKARRQAAALTEEKPRQGVPDVVDVVFASAAEALTRTRAPADAPDAYDNDIARLRNAIAPVAVPPPAKMASFWSTQKAAALGKLPAALKKQVDQAMNRDLGAELTRLADIATRDPAAVEDQAWTVLRIMRAYRLAVTTLPEDNAAVGRSRLLKALDGVGAAVERLLPAPPAPVVV